jgi:hypothetical protein
MPKSFGIGANHGEARNTACVSATPWRHRRSIEERLNS